MSPLSHGTCVCIVSCLCARVMLHSLFHSISPRIFILVKYSFASDSHTTWNDFFLFFFSLKSVKAKKFSRKADLQEILKGLC